MRESCLSCFMSVKIPFVYCSGDPIHKKVDCSSTLLVALLRKLCNRYSSRTGPAACGPSRRLVYLVCGSFGSNHTLDTVFGSFCFNMKMLVGWLHVRVFSISAASLVLG